MGAMSDIAAEVATAERLGIGGNGPPEPIEPTPFEAIVARIADIEDEARLWLDGAVVETQEQADGIALIRELALKAKHDGEALRKAEAKVFDDGKKEVQARYNPLVKDETGKCDLITAACKAAMGPFLQKLEDAQKAEADRLRKEAEDAAEAARVKLAAIDPANLTAKIEAEEAIKTAATANRVATKAENTRAQARGGAGRATSLRSVWTPILTDPVEALKHYRATRPDELKAWLLEQAWQDVRASVRTIPGFNIKEDRVPA